MISIFCDYSIPFSNDKLKTKLVQLISPNTNNIPHEMKRLRQWVCWRGEWDDKRGKIGKPPFNPKNINYGAKAGKPDTWGSFNDALRHKEITTGVGFELLPESGIMAIDIDHCVSKSGVVAQIAIDIITTLGSYSEFSPTGTGIHIYLYGKLPGGGRKIPLVDGVELELYDSGRYVTVTGAHIEGTPTAIEHRQAELDTIIQKYVVPFDRRKEKTNDSHKGGKPSFLCDDDIIQKAHNAKNGEKFGRLWAGDATGYRSNSEADSALCCELAYWTGKDAQRIDSLFRQSGLYRDKWDKKHHANGSTYGQETICLAIETTSNIYEPGKQSEQPRGKTITVNGVFQQEKPDGTMADEWGEPEPIKEIVLEAVKPLTSELIPEQFRPWLTDIAHRKQVPLDYVAVGAMVAVSSVIGAGCEVRPYANDDWGVIPNLWGAVVGRPSAKKTPSLEEAMKPIGMLEVAAKETFEAMAQMAAAEAEAHKAMKAALVSEMTSAAKSKPTTKNKQPARTMEEIKADYASLKEPQEPVRRRYKTNDATIEKLGELLNQNERGLLYFRDELAGLLSSWEREDRQTDRAFFLECWTGKQNYDTDRISRGNVFVKNCCLSILGGIQPKKLLAYLSQSANSLQTDGMMQRFQLLVYPDELPDWELVDEKPDKKARKVAYDVFEKLASMDFMQYGATNENDDGTPFYRFDAAGQQVFYEWLTELETRLRTEDDNLMTEHLGKYRSLMPSIALILHLVSIAAGNNQSVGISAESAGIAAEWCEYLESHARRVYGLLAKSNEEAVKTLSKKILKGELVDGFSVRDVYRNCWSMLATKEEAEAACSELENMNWIRTKTKTFDGRRSQTVYEINHEIKKNLEKRG